MTRDELIKRLEAADGPDRMLDGEIFRAVHPKEPDGDWWAFEGVWHRRYKPDPVAWEAPPSFTGSIDAAASLVPEGWQWDAGTFADDEVFNPGGAQASVHDHRYSDRYAHAEARTPALALCIAALKAMEAA